MSTPKAVLFKGKTLSNGSHPIVLRMYIGKEMRISLGYSAFPDEWNSKTGRFTKKVDNYEEKNNVLWQKELLAEKIIQEMVLSEKAFSFEVFKNLFSGKKEGMTVHEFLEIRLNELTVEGAIGNMNKYKQLKGMLKNYKPTTNLLFTDIDYNFLKGFETYILGRETTTKKSNAYFYMRMLRATYNEAIRRGYVNEESYPFKTQFKKNGYSISHLNGDYNPRPLSMEEFERVINFNVNEHPRFAKSFFYFLFLIEARGLNFSDLCELTDANVTNNRISYIRKKTGKLYNIPITERMASTIKQYRGKKYLYTSMDKAPTNPKARNVYVRNQLKNFNSDLENISAMLAIENKITSYTARYTYTNVLIQRHIAVPFIQQALGHSNISTTQHYIKKFSNEEVDKEVAVF